MRSSRCLPSSTRWLGLRCDATADAVVIGGGIVGVSCRGASRRDRPPGRPGRADRARGRCSGRNSGVVQHPFDPVLVDLHLETVDLYRARRARATVRAARGAGRAAPRHPRRRWRPRPRRGRARRRIPQLSADVPPPERGGRARAVDRAGRGGLPAGRSAIRSRRPRRPMPTPLGRGASAWRSCVGPAPRPWLDGGSGGRGGARHGERIAAGDVVVAAGPWTPAIVDPSGAWRPIRSRWGVVVAGRAARPAAARPRGGRDRRSSRVASQRPDDEPIAFSLVTADGARARSGRPSSTTNRRPAALVPALVERGATFVPAIATAAIGAHSASAPGR